MTLIVHLIFLESICKRLFLNNSNKMTEEDIIQETNRYYRARAVWHDDYMSYTNYDEMVKLLEPLVKLVQEAFAGRDVLEIACGTGTWTQVMARVANSVLATDVADTMIDIAKVKTTGISTINYKAADAYLLDNIDAEFNGAFAADWWSHMPLSKIKQFLHNSSFIIIFSLRFCMFWIIISINTPAESIISDANFKSVAPPSITHKSGGEFLAKLSTLLVKVSRI